MLRLIIRVPIAIQSFSQLSAAHQEAIQRVFGQYVLPMPGTIAADSFQICDGVSRELDWSILTNQWGWPVIGVMGEDGDIVLPLDQVIFTRHLPDTPEYNNSGEIIGTRPAVFHEPHNWAGWASFVNA